MSIEENPAVTQISNPSDRKKMRGMLEEIVHCLRRIEDERESRRVILQEIKTQFNIAPKHAGKLAAAMYKDNFDEIKASQSDFEDLYDTIVRSSPPAVAKFGDPSDDESEIDDDSDE